MKKTKFEKISYLAITGILVSMPIFAQNQGIQAGAQALDQAATDLKLFFEPSVKVIYVVAAITGVYGGFKIYTKMQSGDQDVQKSVINWVGAVLLLLSVGAVLQTVFF